jgi:uncharacterized protein
MAISRFLLILVAVVALGIVGYTYLNNEAPLTTQNSVNYIQNILAERAQKDNFYKTSPESPIEDKATFDSLYYFFPDSNYRTQATILPYNQANTNATIQMSDGTVENYQKYGFAQFKINNQIHKLLIYKQEHGLTIMFRDATAPKETYGGGRYFDFEETDIKNNKFILDFNMAYNPYCAYNHTYACPIPPKENNLTVRIAAGERIFAKNP